MMLSSVCRALHNTLIHHFNISIFNGKNNQWWDPNISWTNKYIDNDPTKGFKKWLTFKFKITNLQQFSDAWHTFNTLEIFCNWLAILTVLTFSLTINSIIPLALFIGLSFISYNLTFSICYDWLYIKGKKLNDYLKSFK